MRYAECDPDGDGKIYAEDLMKYFVNNEMAVTTFPIDFDKGFSFREDNNIPMTIEYLFIFILEFLLTLFSGMQRI